MSTWAKLCQAFYAKFLFFTLHDWNQNQLNFDLRRFMHCVYTPVALTFLSAWGWLPIHSGSCRSWGLRMHSFGLLQSQARDDVRCHWLWWRGCASDGRFRSKRKPTTKTNTAHAKQGVAWPMYPNSTIFPIADLYRNYFWAVCLHLETTKTCMHQVTPDSFRSLDLDRFRWITYCHLINSLCYVARPCLEDLQCQSCSVREALVWATTGKRW